MDIKCKRYKQQYYIKVPPKFINNDIDIYCNKNFFTDILNTDNYTFAFQYTSFLYNANHIFIHKNTKKT